MTIKVTIHPELLPDGIDPDAILMAICVQDSGYVPHPDVPNGPFDDLLQFIETIDELPLNLADSIAVAREALTELRHWCNCEAQASETNFVLWREATRQLEALQAQL